MSVYVVQNTLIYKKSSGGFVPRYDLSQAESFGKLVYCLPPMATARNPGILVDKMRTALKGFCDDDFLLLIGNPCFIGVAVALAAAENYGNVSVLQWDRKYQRYHKIDLVDL